MPPCNLIDLPYYLLTTEALNFDSFNSQYKYIKNNNLLKKMTEHPSDDNLIVNSTIRISGK